jgi:hypothetical protein
VTGDPLPNIIRAVALPVSHVHAKPSRGVDLASHVRALRSLLGGIWEEHDLAERDGALRGSPDKPRREWEKNKRAASPYDYSAHVLPDHAAQFERAWATHYDATYARPASNPKVSRDNGLSLIPLECVYVLLRRWWQANELGSAWDPEYRADQDHGTPLVEYMNPSLRFLYLVARSCGPDYSVANCLSVHDRLRSPARAANKAAKGRAARKKAAKPRTRQKTG